MLLEPALLQQVQGPAHIHGASVAAWMRHAMRQVTIKDLPASWHAEETATRSHESGYYDRKYQLRLDKASSGKLQALAQTLHRSAAEIIRQLISQANPEDFPQSWQLAVNEHRADQDKVEEPYVSTY